jgi:hypothetical protein
VGGAETRRPASPEVKMKRYAVNSKKARSIMFNGKIFRAGQPITSERVGWEEWELDSLVEHGDLVVVEDEPIVPKPAPAPVVAPPPIPKAVVAPPTIKEAAGGEEEGRKEGRLLETASAPKLVDAEKEGEI